jgi:hypothetical protein
MGQGRDGFGGQGHLNCRLRWEWIDGAHLAGRGHRVKGSLENLRSQHFITGMQINLLNLKAHLVRSEFHSAAKQATG